MVTNKKDKILQKTIKTIEASSFAPPYETATNKINTKDTMKNNKEYWHPHLCKCNDISDSRKPTTWESIVKMYGDADTTEVWDEKTKQPIILQKSGNRYKNKIKTLGQKSEHENKNKHRKPKINKKNEERKKSIISFYRSRKNRNKDRNKKTTNLVEYNHDEEIKKASPIVHIKKNPKHKIFFHDGKGDSCVGGPCTNILTDYYNSNEKKYLSKGITDKSKDITENKNKNVVKPITVKDSIKDNKKVNYDKINKKEKQVEIKNNTRNLRMGYENVENVLSKCKNFLKRSFSNKIQNIVVNKSAEPVFEMQVNSDDMHVLNRLEIENNVKRFGTIKSHRSCICPSRIKNLKQREHQICPKGICESAKNNNTRHFDCKCTKQNNTIVCKDTNCDQKYKVNKKNKKILQSVQHNDQNNPIIEVVIDRSDMSILNSYELSEMAKKAHESKICPTGICRKLNKDPEIKLKCKCSRKKIFSRPPECTNKTCTKPKRKSTLSSLCSRVFCTSQYWFSIHRRKHERRSRPIATQKTEKSHVRNKQLKGNSDIANKKTLTLADRKRYNMQSGDGVSCKCFCECDIKYNTEKKKINSPKKKIKKSLKKTSKQKRLQRLRCIKKSKCTRRKEANNWKTYIAKCLKRKRRRCKKKIKAEEKEFQKSEKKAHKMDLEMEKNEKKNKLQDQHWNCLTKFVSGTLNLAVQLIKGVFSVAFSLLLNPIGSYIYIRERARDPQKTVKKIKLWLSRTWNNKTSKVSQTVKESDTMNVIADQIEDLAIYNAIFSNKGKTRAEQLQYERKTRLRKRRIQKRHDAALYGCRHMLLTTMRKTPCLWFYHICPDLYPQCLNLVSFMRNFFHIIIFLFALLCWTPCILAFEFCRAFLCCFFCTN